MALQGTAARLPALRSLALTAPKNLAASTRETHSTQDRKTILAQPAVTPVGHGPRMLMGLRDHPVNRLEKVLLVWAGKYNTIAEVPSLVSQDKLERARNQARIKLNIYMGLATLLGCMVMIWSGKKAHREGQSLSLMNQEWHRRVNEGAKLQREREASRRIVRIEDL